MGRPPVTQPAVPCDMLMPEHFVSTVQCSGTIPLKRYQHEGRGLTLWRAMTRVFLVLDTIPKSAFAVSSWQIHPHLTLGPDARCSRPGGFALRVTLRKGENRYHLRRSLRSGKLRNQSRRIVAMATAEDFADPTARVRCLVVDSFRVSLPTGESGTLIIPTGDPLEHDGPIAYCERLEDIPPHAIWLISATSVLPSPCANWGRNAELIEAHSLPAAQETPHDNGCEHADDYVARVLRQFRHARVFAVLYLGPFVALSLYALLWLFRATGQPGIVSRVLVVSATVWFSVYSAVLVLYAGYLLTETIRECRWRKREGMKTKEWKTEWRGGTLKCLIVGNLMRRGPLLLGKGWDSPLVDEECSGGELGHCEVPDAVG